MVKTKVDITKHVLVPVHAKLSEKDKKELLEKYNISLNELPRITVDDPAIAHLGLKPGDVVKVSRKSLTAGEILYFREVVNA